MPTGAERQQPSTCRASTCPAAAGARSPRRSPAPICPSGGNAFSTPHRQHDRAAELPARRRDGRAGKRAAVRRAVQPAALLGPVAALQRGAAAPAPSSGPSARRWAWPPIRAASRSTRTASLVGGVGVMADGDYGFDPDVSDIDNDDEENDRAGRHHRLRRARRPSRADQVSVDGTSLRYSRRHRRDPESQPGRRAAFAALPAGAGALIAVTGYYDAAARSWPGQAYGTRSLRRPPAATTAEFSNPRRLHPHQRRGRRTAIPIRGRHRRAEVGTPLSAAEVTRPAGGGLQGHEPRARRRSASRSTAAPRCRSRWSTPTAWCWAWCARPTRRSSAPTCRCRRRAPRPSISSAMRRPPTCRPTRAPTSRGFVAAVRTFLGDPDRADRQDRLHRSRSIGNLSRPYFPDGAGRPAATAPSRGRSPSGAPSPPACSRR